MFVLKGKLRFKIDKNIFVFCFKEYLKKKKSFVMIIGLSYGLDFVLFF